MLHGEDSIFALPSVIAPAKASLPLAEQQKQSLQSPEDVSSALSNTGNAVSLGRGNISDILHPVHSQGTLESLEDSFDQFVKSTPARASQGQTQDLVGTMGDHLTNADLGDVLNLEGMDWDASSLFGSHNDQTAIDLSDPSSAGLLRDIPPPASGHLGLLNPQPDDSPSLSWPAEHGLLGDDMNECTSTDLFPSHDSRDEILAVDRATASFSGQEENGIGGENEHSDKGEEEHEPEEESNDSKMDMTIDDQVDYAEPTDDYADSPEEKQLMEHEDESTMGAERNAQEVDVIDVGLDDGFTAPPGRRATREKAPVNYKALLDGPSIARKVVPPKKPAHNEKGQRVYCLCRQPDSGKFMIQCDNCEEWFHGSCVGLTKKVGEKLTTFFCPPCKILLTRGNDQQPSKVSPTVKPSQAGTPTSKQQQQKKTRPANSGPSSPEVSKSSGGRTGQKQTTRGRALEMVLIPNAPKDSKSGKGLHAPSISTQQKPQQQPQPAPAPAPRPVPPPPPPAWTLDNVRVNARRGFTETFRKIFAEASATPETYDLDVALGEGEEDKRIDLNDLEGFVAKLEDELYGAWATIVKGDLKGKLECAAPYKNKYRSLQFNLKDPQNVRLRRLVLTGAVAPAELVKLPPEELGNDAVKAAIEEARRKSLRDSILVNDEPTSFFKKTHKGEIEVVTSTPYSGGGMMEEHPSSMFRSPRLRDNEEGKNGKDEMVKSPDSSEKREGDDDVSDDRAAKKLKVESPTKQDSNDAMEGISFGDSNETETKMDPDKMTTSTPQDDSDGDDAPRTELVIEGDAAGEDYGYEAYEYPTSTLIAESHSPTTTPPHSPPLPTISVDPTAPVWHGRVHMPQVGRFQGRARQTHGPLIGTPSTWEDLLPATVAIDGRVAINAMEKYLREQRIAGGKQVVVVQFSPLEDAQDDQDGYAQLFDYFATRERAAVVGHHYVSIKDMYIIPIAKDCPLPEFLDELGPAGDQAPVGVAEWDTLFGVIILCKGFGGSGSAGNEFEEQKKRDRSPPQTFSAAGTSSSSSASISIPPQPPFSSKPSLLDTFAPLLNTSPITPSLPTSASSSSIAATVPVLQQPQQQPSTNALLTSLLSNPGNLGMLQGLLAQLNAPAAGPAGTLSSSSNMPGVGPDIHSLLSALGSTTTPLQQQQQQEGPPPSALLASLAGYTNPTPHHSQPQQQLQNHQQHHQQHHQPHDPRMQAAADPRMHPARAAQAQMRQQQDQQQQQHHAHAGREKKSRWG
ncbi:hypothetical protein DFJ77DRAFT_460468 [Powellomyces hirtus]|nr:hypothetical protein DFJ77DRAFT_460468 [Powellomyces hirtus]